MPERVSVGYRLSVSRWVAATGERGLVLWERISHTAEQRAVGTIGRSTGHAVDVDTLTVTPSIAVDGWHGWLTDGQWKDAS